MHTPFSPHLMDGRIRRPVPAIVSLGVVYDAGGRALSGAGLMGCWRATQAAGDFKRPLSHYPNQGGFSATGGGATRGRSILPPASPIPGGSD